MENDPVPANPGGVLIDIELQKIKAESNEEETKGCLRMLAGGLIFAVSFLASIHDFSSNSLTVGDVAKLGFLFGGIYTALTGVEKYFINASDKEALVHKLRVRYTSLLAPGPNEKR